ncbi:MAG: DegT/DnrJ/EryC1/StrS family aminotransferase [Planctomycetota bacterium]
MVKTKIPWARPEIGQEELDEVIDSFHSDWLTMGPKVKGLEQKLCSFLDVPYGIAVSNGTVALDLALKAVGVGADDEVIVPAMTYFATSSSVSYQNAVPVFVDIEKESFNLDPERIAEAITARTKAIVFIDYGGNPSDYGNIAQVGREYGIPVIQDGAQSLGGIYKGRRVGAQAEISTTSFHMAKVMTTIEGGMVFTHNETLRDDILLRRNQGEPLGGKYRHIALGTNARMTDLQAAVGLAQFRKLPLFLKTRRRIAARYDQMLACKEDKIAVATERENSSNAYFFYPILIDKRDELAHVLRERYDIDTRIAYPMPIYEQEVYASGRLKYRKMDCPVAKEVTSKILDLPIFPSMTNEMVDSVCEAILRKIT